MPMSCAVRCCKNVRKKDGPFHFFRFPKDTSLKKTWIKQCRRGDKFSVESSRVCSKHFEEDDFENLMEYKLMAGKRLSLKKNAVPKLNLKTSTPEGTNTAKPSERTIRQKKRHNKQEIDQLLRSQPSISKAASNDNLVNHDNVSASKESNSSKATSNDNLVILNYVSSSKESNTSKATSNDNLVNHDKFSASKKSNTSKATSDDNLVNHHDNVLATGESNSSPMDLSLKTVSPECEKLTMQISELKKEIDILKSVNKYKDSALLELRNKCDESKKDVVALRRKLEALNRINLKAHNRRVHADVRKVLSKIFTEDQIKLLLEKQKRVRWSEKDISLAFTIRYYSKRCYIYLRDKLHYPLPGLSTLRSWAAKVHKERGVLNGVLNFLQVAGTTMSPIEKLVVLQYDEIKVAENYEYDQADDAVLGPHKYLQVVNARSLCGKWKQPIFAEFDQKMTEEVLYNLCSKLCDIGFRVVACVSDCGTTNTGFWTKLGVSWKKPWIKHPCMDSKIFFFADAPHTLKLIRNWLLDTGFVLKNGQEITKKPLMDLISVNQPEVSYIHKLTEEHLNCEGPLRQRVSLATQLLSYGVSSALTFYGHDNDNEYSALAEFIETINNWFDCMNSYLPSASSPTKSGYGRSGIKQVQDECLGKVFDTVLHMRRINKPKNMLKFQDGILLSIKALQEMFIDLQSDYNITYILTHKLNLDENLFSQLNDHPTPLDALNRLRIIVLAESDIVQSRTDTIDENYIVGHVLRRTGVEVTIPSAVKQEIYEDLISTSSRSPERLAEDFGDTYHEIVKVESDGICEHSYSLQN